MEAYKRLQYGQAAGTEEQNHTDKAQLELRLVRGVEGAKKDIYRYHCFKRKM